jgi:hypothetical protein
LRSPGRGIQIFRFNQIETIGAWRAAAPSNDRETGKKMQLRRDNDRFPPESGCRLSYQAGRIPRILPFSGMPVGGDR